MKQPVLRSILLLLAAFSCGCGPDNRQPHNEGAARKSDTPPQHRLFLKVFRVPVNDTVYHDSMRLQLRISGDSAKGIYRWVLPGKDGKEGSISGRLLRDTIRGYYHYQQEGGAYTDPIEIILEDERAVVTQFTAGSYQLTDTIPAAAEQDFLR